MNGDQSAMAAAVDTEDEAELALLQRRGTSAAERLKSFIQRIEAIDVEIKGLREDQSEIYREAAAVGYSRAAIRLAVMARRKPKHERIEQDATVRLYLRAAETGAQAISQAPPPPQPATPSLTPPSSPA